MYTHWARGPFTFLMFSFSLVVLPHVETTRDMDYHSDRFPNAGKWLRTKRRSQWGMYRFLWNHRSAICCWLQPSRIQTMTYARLYFTNLGPVFQFGWCKNPPRHWAGRNPGQEVRPCQLPVPFRTLPTESSGNDRFRTVGIPKRFMTQHS